MGDDIDSELLGLVSGKARPNTNKSKISELL